MDDLEAFLGLSGSSTPPPPAPVLTGELVAPRPRKEKKITGSHPLTPRQIRERDRSFSEVSIFDEKTKAYLRGRLSDRERKLVTFVLKTGNVDKAAEEIGVGRATAFRYLRRPGVRIYLEIMRKRAAQAADLTPDKVAAVISRAVDGDETLKPGQIAAAQSAAKLLAPAAKPGVSVTVNQQNNYGAGASPFAELDQKAMLDAVKENLLEMGHGE